MGAHGWNIWQVCWCDVVLSTRALFGCVGKALCCAGACWCTLLGPWGPVAAGPVVGLVVGFLWAAVCCEGVVFLWCVVVLIVC